MTAAVHPVVPDLRPDQTAEEWLAEVSALVPELDTAPILAALTDWDVATGDPELDAMVNARLERKRATAVRIAKEALAEHRDGLRKALDKVSGEAEFTARKAERLAWLRANRDAQREIEVENASALDEEAVARFMAEALPETSLGSLPDVEWLVDGWFFKDSVARVIGAGGTMKTFLMMSIASCVARRRDWFGSTVNATTGRVLYVLAESPRGAKARLEAFRLLHDLEATDNLVLLPRAVQLAGPEMASLIEYAKRVRFDLIIFDTQAKCTEGLNENDVKDTSLWIGAANRLREATGACVVLVHHTGHGKGEVAQRGRGSSAAYSGVDTEILVQKNRGGVIQFKPIRLKEEDVESRRWEQLKAVPSGNSIALTDEGADLTQTPAERKTAELEVIAQGVAEAETHLERLARVLAKSFNGTEGITKEALRKVYTEDLGKLGKLPPSGRVTDGSWYRVFGEMEKSGWLERHPRRTASFVLSETGCASVGVPYVRPAWVEGDPEDDYFETS